MSMGLQHNKKYTKCAKVVGQAMGEYHPHGDSADLRHDGAHGAAFHLRYPLVDGQGNFGSVDGDPPAAMRYTECRLTRIAGAMLKTSKRRRSILPPTMTSRRWSRRSFPRAIPNLLMNGSNGIAVGMATNIPPHNLTEID